MKKLVLKTIAATLSLIGSFMAFSPAVYAIGGGGNVDFSGYYADYNDITFTTPLGGSVVVSLSGKQISCTTSYSCDVTIQLKNAITGMVLGTGSGSNITLDGSSLAANTSYYLFIRITADGKVINEHMELGLDNAGNISFIKSAVYDFNVERCSELWTDQQSLDECLEPMNDQECDNPDVIALAEQITSGARNDFEKSLRIYEYITQNYAYNYDESEDVTGEVYQDDVATLTRRSLAICEGMANSFVGLARAVGIPSAVSFGILEQYSLGVDDDTRDSESPNHAWAVVYLGGQWYHIDPTQDVANTYYEGVRESIEGTFDYYLVPLEVFSYNHKICDADTRHGIESTGSCGDSASYSINRDGVITISGSGSIVLPYGVNGFRRVEFAEGSNITDIGAMCFVDCDIIESIILPDTVTTISRYAFYTCEDLEYVYIPDSVTSIGASAFGVCDELAYIRVPDGCTLASQVFDNCPRLIVSIPSTISQGEVTSGLSVAPARVLVR